MTEPYAGYPDDVRQIGQWIERQRKARKWSQEQLAARAGVHRVTVYKVEAGCGGHTASVFSLILALDGKFSIKTACCETSTIQP